MRYVILGNGPAGVSALVTIREMDPTGEISVVSPESYRHYSKTLLTHWIAGKAPFKDLFLVDEGFYDSRGVSAVFGVSATRIDPAARSVELSNRQNLTYDALLLGMGSVPQVPDVRGIRLPGIHYLRTFDDAERLVQAAAAARRAVVIGGGLIGLKISEALITRGVEVLLVVSSDRLLSRITTPDDRDAVLRLIDSPGLHILLNRDVVEIEGHGRAERVRLSGGESIHCDMVVVGKGVTPNLLCTRDTGIITRRGVVVDDRMQTSVPGIYAAGDIAEGFDIARGVPAVNPLWSSAVRQGRIAGCNMAGRKASHPGDVAMNSVTFREACVVALGKPRPEEGDEVVTIGPGTEEHRRLVFRDGRLVGAVITGHAVQAADMLHSLIARRADVAPIKDVLLAPRLTREDILNAETRLPNSMPLA